MRRHCKNYLSPQQLDNLAFDCFPWLNSTAAGGRVGLERSLQTTLCQTSIFGSPMLDDGSKVVSIELCVASEVRELRWLVEMLCDVDYGLCFNSNLY